VTIRSFHAHRAKMCDNACYSFATSETLVYQRPFLLYLSNDPTSVNLSFRCDEHQSARNKLMYWWFFHLFTDFSSVIVISYHWNTNREWHLLHILGSYLLLLPLDSLNNGTAHVHTHQPVFCPVPSLSLAWTPSSDSLLRYIYIYIYTYTYILSE
jgi:hypothetical protein